MSDKDERIKRRVSGKGAMASCVLTDADGNQVHVGEWLPQSKASDTENPKVRKTDNGQQTDEN